MRLFLLRHAEAVPGHPDETRSLAPRGREELDRLCRVLHREKALNPDILWVSPLDRARETADRFCRALRLDLPTQVREDLVPEANPARLAREIATQESNLLIIGHNPHLEMLIAYLLTGKSDGCMVLMNTASLACIELTGLQNNPGGALLRWVVSPNILTRA